MSDGREGFKQVTKATIKIIIVIILIILFIKYA